MLRKIFLSYHFDEESKKLASKIENLIRSFNIMVVTGEHVAGAKLATHIKSEIEKCDALIFILSKRAEGRTNDWVLDEVATAKANNKLFFGLLEEGITIPSPLVGREYYTYSSSESSNLWLKLCNTLNIWIKQKGRPIFAIIQPDTLVEELREFSDLDT